MGEEGVGDWELIWSLPLGSSCLGQGEEESRQENSFNFVLSVSAMIR